MKPIVLVAFAPLALAACNSSNPFGGSSSGNTMAAVPVTPDAVIVNGVTYVRAGGPSVATVPATSPTVPVASTVPTVTPTVAPSPVVPDTTPPPSSSQPDGVTVTGGH